jgi:2-phosphosulfolactate phosphatase
MIVKISIFQGHEPDLPQADINVVIDVIRAFTTTHVAFERGVDEVLLAGEVDEAFALKERFGDYVLAGERDAIKVEGFDLGNSPYECTQIDLAGRSMILSTTNGVRATLHALRSVAGAQVLVTGFTNAAQTADHIRHLGADGAASRINLIASNPTGDDDLACAEYIRDRILPVQDRKVDGVDEHQVTRRIRECDSAQKFLDPERKKYDRRDVEICMTPRQSDFVMHAQDRAGQPVIKKQKTAN